MAIASIAGVSNVELWNLARKMDPTFASHTAKATADTFTVKGYEAITRNNATAINEFFGVSLRIMFQLLNAAGAKNPLADAGLVEVFETPNGGYTQRMSVDAVKPVSPAYRGLEDGSSVDPFIVRKPEVNERFYPQNFDFQNFITYQNFNAKTIFLSEYGMGQLLAGIMKSLQASYTKQEYYNVLECINAALNSTATPLQDSQVVRLSSWTDAAPTTAELTEFIQVVKNVVRDMETSASTSKYNASGFDDVAYPEDHVLLVRPEVLTDIEVLNKLNAPGSGFPLEVKAIANFGGMTPYVLSDPTDPTSVAYLQPIYDALGTAVAYVDATATVNGSAKLVNGKWVVNITSGGTTADTNVTFTDSEVLWEDGNAEVLGVIAQKGVIFENTQNPYTVEPIRNPRGMYDNYWANRPGTSLVYDSYRNLVAIAKPIA